MKRFLLFLSIFVAGLLMASCGSSSPSEVTNSYYKALQKGDFEKALTYTTIEDKAEIKQEIEKMEGLEVKIPEFDIVSEEIAEDGTTAVVEVKYKFTSSFNSEPEESTNNVKLVKKDGKWKIKG